MIDQEPVLYEVSDRIARITLNRPEKKNALKKEMYISLRERLLEADQDDGVHVILFAGNGDTFCAGNDISDFVPDTEPDEQAEEERRLAVIEYLVCLSDIEKPLIALANGSAIGVGFTMLLHFDFILASPTARFTLPFSNYGLVPEAASSQLLPALVGHNRAAQMLLLGDTMTADYLHNIGLIMEVLEPDLLTQRGDQLAATLAAKPNRPLRDSKRLLKRPPESIRERILHEGEFFTFYKNSEQTQAIFRSFFSR